MVWNPNDTECTVCGYPTKESRVRGLSIDGAPAAAPPNPRVLGEGGVIARVCGRCGNMQLKVSDPARFEVRREQAS